MELGKNGHTETDEERIARHDLEEFDRKIKEGPHEVSEKYLRFLRDEREKEMARMKQEGRPGLASIGLERRKELYSIAETAVDMGSDPDKMEKDWEAATDKTTGRPPIGGAPDD